MKIKEPKERYDSAKKKIIIIAGANGAGKTTFADEYLRQEAGCFAFVNADNIAFGLSPYDVSAVSIRAGRLLIKEIDRHARAGISFAFETTLSGSRYADRIRDWRAGGYGVKLVFLYLPSVEMAVARVSARVEQGGHDVPENTIRRRYRSGLNNFNETYKKLVDVWQVYDNSELRPVLVDEGES